MVKGMLFFLPSTLDQIVIMDIIMHIRRKLCPGGKVMSLGLRIKTMRRALGLTQQALADRTEVSRIYIQALKAAEGLRHEVLNNLPTPWR